MFTHQWSLVRPTTLAAMLRVPAHWFVELAALRLSHSPPSP